MGAGARLRGGGGGGGREEHATEAHYGREGRKKEDECDVKPRLRTLLSSPPLARTGNHGKMKEGDSREKHAKRIGFYRSASAAAVKGALRYASGEAKEASG